MGFEVGKKVVCIDAIGHPELIQDKIYTVTHVYNGSCCGILAIRIGISVTQDKYKQGRCVCGHQFTLTPRVVKDFGFVASRFVPLDEYIANEHMVDELVKESEKNIFLTK